jgi:hypothetical protein
MIRDRDVTNRLGPERLSATVIAWLANTDSTSGEGPSVDADQRPPPP